MYISTRNHRSTPIKASEAIKNGLAPDGGLYMPTELPRLTEDDLAELAPLSYPERCAKILSLFLDDYGYEELLDDAMAAYSEEKFGAHPAPVKKVEDESYFLELWHGPTCAFKDMALQLMPRLFVRALKKCGETREALILVATSGDTGKAALEGYKNVKGTKVKVFYPQNGVSAVQKLQMQTQDGDNLSVDGIEGNFDDAQSGVKTIFSAPDVAEKLDCAGVFLSSANSINWGRLVPQIVYYVSAYLDLVSAGEIAMYDELDVTVPTGNFGNIFAAYIAKKMGVPLGKLVCASNKNDVLTEFFASGRYNRNRQFYPTVSPSMDILISSNLERLLYLALGSEKCAAYMHRLSSTGEYTLSAEDFALVCADFAAYSTSEEDTLNTVSDYFKNKNYLIDTHTAGAASAAKRFMNDYKAERKMLTVSTASPFKFASDVYASLTGERPSELLAPELLGRLSGVDIPTPIATLKDKMILHSRSIKKEEMEKATLDFART